MNKFYQSVQLIRPEKWLFIFVHISVWLMLFVAFILSSMRQNQSLPVHLVLQYSYGFILFYLNYFYLTPRFLLPKKYMFFALSILAIILISFLLVDPVIQKLSFNDFIRHAPPGFEAQMPHTKFKGQMTDGERFFFLRRSMGMFFLLFAFLTFSSSVRIFQKLMREEDLSKQYQHEKLNAELMLLRQQINPHFLFNSLNNIHSLAHRKSDLTSEAIMKLSAFLRNILKDNSGREMPVSQEVALIGNYIDLQKLWMKNQIKVEFETENISDQYCVEPFILNPLVENAFKYGVIPGMESTISIRLKMVADWLHVNISNPVLLERNSEVSSLGIGVNNVINRLELCYQGNYKIENVRQGTNYLVNLSIKLKNNELYSNR
ncbi:MAG: histidine kinase [Prolixibacteraceae bacterium]